MKQVRALALAAIFACAAISAAGCNSVVLPKTPAQTVYGLTGVYAGALSIEVAYKNLPPCSTGITPVCSEQSVVDSLKAADDKAWPVLQTAQAAVRAHITGSTLSGDLAAAQSAVQAFQGLTANLRLH